MYKNSAKARSIGYADELAPTLRAEQTPAVIVLQDKIIGRKDKNTCNGDRISEGVCYTLTSTDVHGVCVPVVYDARGNGDGEISPTITGDHNGRVTDYTAVLCEAIIYNGAAVTSPANKQNPQHGDPCHTLSTDSRNYVVMPAIEIKDNESMTKLRTNETSLYLLKIRSGCEGGGKGALIQKDKSATLACNNNQILFMPIDDITYIVRRLTPSECAKVQGFPTDWHKGIVNAKGKEMPDTATYRGYGNAVATVCAEYPIQGIYEILSKEERK